MNRKIFLRSSIFSLIGWQTLSDILENKEGRKTEGIFRKNSIPELFLIGDSITVQYTPHLEHYLYGVVEFDRKRDDGRAEQKWDVPTGANGGDSAMVLAYVSAKLRDKTFSPDYLILNCGLHDIKRHEDNQLQVSPENYQRHHLSIVDLLVDYSIRLI